MSTLYEIFGDCPICEYAGIQNDSAGGYDVVCKKCKIGILYCHSKCNEYKPLCVKNNMQQQ